MENKNLHSNSKKKSSVIELTSANFIDYHFFFFNAANELLIFEVITAN